MATGNCIWTLVPSTPCERDESYPAMLNGKAGSRTTLLRCGERTEAGKQRYYFSDFAEIDEYVRAATGILGIAFPLKSGEFLVQRFNLTGAVEALDAIRDAASVKREKRVKPTTKDEKL